MNKTVVINVVGLSKRLIGEHTPFLTHWVAGKNLQHVKPALPAVTCTTQSNYLTGKPPADHGIVGNGWFFKDELEIKFWRQSNRLVNAPKIWDELKSQDKDFTCANMFWWYNMYSSVDYSATPRPNYHADGRKTQDCYTYPAEIRDKLQAELGTFPLFKFWGPMTSIESSQWIANAAKLVQKWHNPTLELIYLPHLDYNMQRHGVNFDVISKDLNEIDSLCQDLISHFESKEYKVILLSEYGITDVDHPIHINRILRENGFLSIRTEPLGELLDAGASQAFAVADHQVAHVYVNDASCLEAVRKLLERTNGIEHVYDKAAQVELGLTHERAGDFVVIGDSRSWFTYYYWLDDNNAPDFARTVEIHRKPGYDPAELFLNPEIPLPYFNVATKLIRKKLGFRTLMDLIPLEAGLVKGSHGRLPEDSEDWPILAGSHSDKSLQSTDVYAALLDVILS